MKTTFLPLMLFLLNICLSNTNYAQQVVSSAGADWNDNQVNLCWTLGETAILSLKNDVELTQGFHQPDLLVSSIYRLLGTEINIDVYPNPVVSLLNIKITTSPQKCRVMLVNSNGETLLSEDMFLTKDPAVIDFTLFSPGIYFVRVINSEDLVLESFKIVKS